MNKSPRVLFLTSSFPVPGYPASGVFVFQLADSLGSHCNLDVLTPDSDFNSDRDNSNVSKDFHITRFRYAPKKIQKLFHKPGGLPEAIRSDKWTFITLPLALFSMTYQIFKLSRNIDLIHANWSLTAVLALFSKMLLRKPVIVTFRGSDISLANNNIIAKQLVRLCIKYCDQLVCVNSSMQQALIDYYHCPRKILSVIPNGVSEEFTDLPLKQNYSEPIKFIFIGNLTKNKSVDVLLKTLESLDGINFQFNIIGSGPEEQYLKNLSDSLGITGKVYFLGQCLPEKIPHLLQDSDIFLFSSKSEGRPNVLLEAMAASKVILASKISGVTDLISDNKTGLLYTPGDQAELRSLINMVANNQEYAHQLGKQARNYISDSGLTWNQCAKQYLSLYKKVAPTSAP